MKRTIFFILFTFSLLKGWSQEDPQHVSNNAVYFELGGNGLFYSLNYDRIILSSRFVKASIRIGYGTILLSTHAIPVEVNVLLGKKKHYGEIGYGRTLMISEDFSTGSTEKWEYETYAFARLGYRFQKQEKGFFFRIAFTPIVGVGTSGPWAGAAAGYSF